MRNIGFIVFLMLCILCDSSYGDSLLQPQSFPTTADDLTFIQTINLKQDGYEAWETIYDDNGRCVSGCLYPGITIQEDMEISYRHTVDAWSRVQQYLATQPQAQQQQPLIQQYTSTAFINPTQYVQSVAPQCFPSNSAIPRHQKLPFGKPLSGNTSITSGYGWRIHPVTGESSKHSGVDFSAPIGTNVFSPADGTVVSVGSDSSCGNGLTIAHDAEHETVYCHLSKVVVKNGDRVYAGCKVAETGNTGRTTGPHLHYAIKERGEYVNPMSWILGG